MKVGRREFLRLIGAAAAGAVVPKGREPEGDTPAVVSDGWHHFASSTWNEDGIERHYVDGQDVTALSLEEYAKRIGFDAVIGNPPWQPEAIEEIINTGPVDVLEGEPCGPLSLDSSGWIPSMHSRDDCPACQAALREYDCDYYMPIAQGGWVETWADPYTGCPFYTHLEWYDHGLHTTFRVGDRYVGEVLSAQVDPSEYLRSIWAAGQVALRTVLAKGFGGGHFRSG